VDAHAFFESAGRQLSRWPGAGLSVILIDVLTATVQKVNQKVELGKSTPQSITNYE
jgi:hypothetical protein